MKFFPSQKGNTSMFRFGLDFFFFWNSFCFCDVYRFCFWFFGFEDCTLKSDPSYQGKLKAKEEKGKKGSKTDKQRENQTKIRKPKEKKKNGTTNLYKYPLFLSIIRKYIFNLVISIDTGKTRARLAKLAKTLDYNKYVHATESWHDKEKRISGEEYKEALLHSVFTLNPMYPFPLLSFWVFLPLWFGCFPC